MRRIAPILLASLILVNTACSGHLQGTNSAEWRPSSTPGVFRRDLAGDPRQPGPFRYQLRIPAGTQISAHVHSADVHVKILTGSMFIVLGEPLDRSRAQHFTARSTFVVRAGVWHAEWWDEETVVEAEGVGPQVTTYKK